MNRFFSPKLGQQSIGSRIELSGDNARHAVQVLRLRPRDNLIVCDGRGADYLCEVTEVFKDALGLAVVNAAPNPAEPSVKVYLFQSLIKADKLEYAVQKAVELGVAGVFPFQSEHSVVRLSGSSRDSGRTERLMKISEAAAKQSGRGVIPHCGEAVDFITALSLADSLAPELALAAHEKADLPLKERLAGVSSGPVAVFIGPEGGFSGGEIAAFEERGIVPVSLGKRVLRAETAGIAALANILYQLEG